MSLLSAFTQAVLPVLAVAGVGYVLGVYTDVEPKPLSTVTVYVLIPALVFHSLATTEIGGGEGTRIVLVAVMMTFVMWAVSEGVAVFASNGAGNRNGLVLAGTFPNTANYGIPLSVFAFPSVGRTTAVLYVVGSTVMLYTVGVYVASRDAAGSSLGAVKRVARLPLVYAVVAGVAVNFVGFEGGGSSAFETLRLVGDSSIPIMLIVLGVQLARSTTSGAVRDVALANVLRLVVAPIVAVPVVLAFGFTNPDVARVVVLESSTPVAVSTVILTVEFGGDTDYTATAVLTTTLASVLTVTLLIELLNSGVFL
ncbi:MAG: AEC family transporter [Halobacteriales archaeon]|nr:AEC family transporter [Halobacteriales archaeon]